MGIAWALATGRDRDMGPPLGWWRGPAWVGWVLLLVGLGWWSANGFLVWTSAAMGNELVGGALVLVQISAVLLVRYRPLTAVRVSVVATVVAALVARPIPRAIGVVHSWPLDAYLLPLAVVVILVMARGPSVRGIALLACLAVVFAAVVVGVRYGIHLMAGPFAGLVLTLIAGWVLNDSRKARQERTHLSQRNKIARELHDVIGHHLSMIAVRTDSARYRISGVTPDIQEEFSALGTAARDALTEARRLLGVLREDDAEAEHVPQPTIDDIADLVRSAVASGATVRLDMPAHLDVPAIVGLAAYRIVQESLSNAMRHSPGAPIDVRLRATARDIELSVDNGPCGLPAVPGEGSGLAGIRERVTVIGGECTAGRRADGGFRVWARLPR